MRAAQSLVTKPRVLRGEGLAAGVLLRRGGRHASLGSHQLLLLLSRDALLDDLATASHRPARVVGGCSLGGGEACAV